MNHLLVSNFEILQATIEAMGAVFCLIAMFFLQFNNKSKASKVVSTMFSIDSVVLLFDAGAYIFRGNISPFCLFMTRLCNFSVFALQIILALYAIHLTYILIEQYDVKPSPIYKYIGYALGLIAIIILVVNLFTNFMYYFDENNYYHRNSGFYIFNPLSILIMILTVFIVLRYHKHVNKELIIGILLYELIPAIAVFIQVFIYGIILTNISIILSLIIILLIDIRITEHNENGITEETIDARKTLSVVIMIFILITILSSSLVINIRTIQKISEENKKENSETKFFVIRNGIEKELLRPIIISDTLAQDTSLKRAFQASRENPEMDISQDVSEVLNSIKNGFNYKMAFAVCDATRNYYTYNGYSRNFYKDISFDDSWYDEFINSENIYELNIDKDKDNNLSLSVFINRRIVDDEGNLLGACGVGVDLQELTEVMSIYETKYDVDISFVTSDGLIRVNSDLDSIEKLFVDNSYFNSIGDGEIHYEIIDGKERMTMYMDYFNWYLVINNINKLEADVGKIVWPSILVFFIGALIMTGVFVILFEREKSASKALVNTTRISYTDKMTGIGNLRAYDKACENILLHNKLTDYCIVMFDVNGLKYANDNIGHEAGDELIIGTAECCKKAFGKYGDIYRTGGDEFFALLCCNRDEIETAEKEFEAITSSWKGKKNASLNVSLGYVIASENPELSLDDLERKAEEIMYKNKSNFYLRTGIERRKR